MYPGARREEARLARQFVFHALASTSLISSSVSP
jgi:hypothetical protein